MVSENALLPEISVCRQAIGWYRQQVAKFAAASLVESDFYLTLDADVICTRSFRVEDVLVDGKALAPTTTVDHHPQYYERAEEILGVERSGVFHGATPILYSTQGMRELCQYLSEQAPTVCHLIAKTFGRRGAGPGAWRSHLLRLAAGWSSSPASWTEQTLYFTFLEAFGLFDQYHVNGSQDAIYDAGASLWFREHLASWDPERAFNPTGRSYFVVMQSNSGVDVEFVRRMVEEHL